MKRKPTSPGEILSEEFLKPLGLTQQDLASHLGCDYKVINRIVNEKASVTPEMALKLAAAFKTTPRFLAKRSNGGRPMAAKLTKAKDSSFNSF